MTGKCSSCVLAVPTQLHRTQHGLVPGWLTITHNRQHPTSHLAKGPRPNLTRRMTHLPTLDIWWWWWVSVGKSWLAAFTHKFVGRTHASYHMPTSVQRDGVPVPLPRHQRTCRGVLQSCCGARMGLCVLACPHLHQLSTVRGSLVTVGWRRRQFDPACCIGAPVESFPTLGSPIRKSPK